MTLEKIIDRLERFEEFAGSHRVNGNDFKLGNHQLLPIFDAVENGLKRFILAYGTGAGKTAVPIEIIKHLRDRGEDIRTLAITPKQTMEHWREDLSQHQCDVALHQMRDRSDKVIPHESEFVLVNYDKLSPKLDYVEQLVNYADRANLVIADEFHNMKNIRGKRTESFKDIIEISKHQRFIGLSATPIPDRLKDAGMMLYALHGTPEDPDRFKHYGDICYHVKEDPEALWEAKEKGMIRFFDRGATAEFHGLDEFEELDPKKVKMPKKYALKYLDQYKHMFDWGKIHNLERTSIEAMIHSTGTHDFLRKKLEAGYTLNFFSHLVNEAEGEPEDRAIFSQLERMLREEVNAEEIAVIRGSTPRKKRQEIQERMRKGELDALINQWDCTSEGFSEVAGDRPILLVPLRSPFSPGRYNQIIGRSYRPGQEAQVQYIEFHPHSNALIEEIDKYVREYAEQNNVWVKTTWKPSLFHKDAHMIRKGKERKTSLLFNQGTHQMFDSEELDINSVAKYAKRNSVINYAGRLSDNRIIDFSDRGKSKFGDGVRDGDQYVGTEFADGLGSGDNAEPMGKDYSLEDILLYTPGKINLVLSQAVDNIKERQQAYEESWKIADLGCCSSAVFSQARLVYQTLMNQQGKKGGLDEIVNIDGVPGFIRNARHYLEDGEWINTISKLSFPNTNEQDMRKLCRGVRSQDYIPLFDFKVADFTSEDLTTDNISDYDAVIASQCFQYNNQIGNRDVERSMININQALRLGGHCLVALTGNSYQRSFTTPYDIENFKRVAEAYDFKVKKYSHISGEKDGEQVLRPFHYFHLVKRANYNSDLIDFNIIPVIYPDRREVLTGGHREERFKRTSPKIEANSFLLPNKYINEDGQEVEL